MLRKRLDDAVLDNLTLILVRNQMYKLTTEDVQVRLHNWYGISSFLWFSYLAVCIN